MNKLFLGLLLIFVVSCAPNDGAKSFAGTWVDAKQSQNIWKIEASGSTITGTQLNGDSGLPKTESWTVFGKNGLWIGKSKSKDGASLTYFPNRDEILRTPPGIMYKRKK